jgi:NarL family two-component system response regulator YdfI
MSETIRVLMADDHLIVREGLQTILETVEDLELVGEARDGVEAVQLSAELLPDVVLMDLRMPRMDGIEAIRQIKAQHPQIEIVILTTYDEDEYIIKGLQAGARGYLLKDSGRQALFNSIRAAARGESLLRSAVIEKVVAHLAGKESGTPAPLSEREMEVLRRIAQGAANKEIAHQLSISERTVKAHVTAILNKLGVNSRTEAVSLALREGLLPLD